MSSVSWRSFEGGVKVWTWPSSVEKVSFISFQFVSGLCLINHGKPRMTSWVIGAVKKSSFS